jgi:phosphoglycerate dehydrogenase-like enzyme
MTARLYLVLLLACLAPASTVASVVEELGLREAPTPVRDDPRWSPQGPIVVRVDRPETLELFRAVAGDVELIGAVTAADALAAVGRATALVGFCSAELLDAGPKLRWVQIYSAGAERCVPLPRIASGEILLTNMQRVSSQQIAEHVIGLLLALTRGLGPYIQNQARADWDPQAVPMNQRWEIGGRQMLVVGLGGIGTEVARRAHALGMQVTAIRASGRPGPEFVSEVARPDELLERAAGADVVVNSAPLTSETRGLFDARFFDAMPVHALFINVGRGASVVTDDLVAALDTGRIGGAGLDVTDPEPLPPSHPLWRSPNVIITPHVAAGSDKVLTRLIGVARENLRRYLAGEPMLSVVDVDRGY